MASRARACWYAERRQCQRWRHGLARAGLLLDYILVGDRLLAGCQNPRPMELAPEGTPAVQLVERAPFLARQQQRPCAALAAHPLDSVLQQSRGMSLSPRLWAGRHVGEAAYPPRRSASVADAVRPVVSSGGQGPGRTDRDMGVGQVARVAAELPPLGMRIRLERLGPKGERGIVVAGTHTPIDDGHGHTSPRPRGYSAVQCSCIRIRPDRRRTCCVAALSRTSWLPAPCTLGRTSRRRLQG